MRPLDDLPAEEAVKMLDALETLERAATTQAPVEAWGGTGWPREWAGVLNTPKDEAIVWPMRSAGQTEEAEPFAVFLHTTDQSLYWQLRNHAAALIRLARRGIELDAFFAREGDNILSGLEVAEDSADLAGEELDEARNARAELAALITRGGERTEG